MAYYIKKNFECYRNEVENEVCHGIARRATPGRINERKPVVRHELRTSKQEKLIKLAD